MNQGERLHSLDAVRAFALLAGIVLHVSWPFLPGLAGTSWALADPSSSVALGVLFYTIHNFRMPLFFMIAGFFARVLLHRRGVWPFIRNRTMRILVPLVIGWVLLYPLIWAAFAWPVMKANGFVLPRLPSFFNSRWSFPLAHLWFLYYLLLMYGSALACRWMCLRLIDRHGGLRRLLDHGLTRLMGSRWMALLLALLPAYCLFLNAEWFTWFGLATPDTSLRPSVPPTVTFGTAFTLGWWLNRHIALLRSWECHWRRHVAEGALLTAVCLILAGVTPTYAAAPHNAHTLIYATCYMTASWSWSFGIIGVAMAYCAQPSAARRYLADASYWMYLVHLPVVLILQAAMRDQPWPWTLKFALNLGVTFAVLLASYQSLVRFSPIGLLLNGRRFPTPEDGTAMARAEPSH
jgi:glucans biosynthesis protein C